jgi:hypothetical protein
MPHTVKVILIKRSDGYQPFLNNHAQTCSLHDREVCRTNRRSNNNLFLVNTKVAVFQAINYHKYRCVMRRDILTIGKRSKVSSSSVKTWHKNLVIAVRNHVTLAVELVSRALSCIFIYYTSASDNVRLEIEIEY